MYDKQFLDHAGCIIMLEVRDKAISRFDDICAEQLKSRDALALSAKVKRFSDEEKAVIREFVIESVDASIFNMLTMLEEHEDSLSLRVALCDEERDIARISDGLGGELFGEDGWINTFSAFA